jgi:hypothetical protein
MSATMRPRGAAPIARLGVSPTAGPGPGTGYPWVDGEVLYAADLNAAIGSHLPAVVGSVYLVSQTGALPGTIIFTPTTARAYRISIYLGIQATGNNVTVNASVAWNDGSPRSYNTAQINMSTGANNPVSTVLPIISVGGQGIGYSTSVTGALGAGQYMLAIGVEQLS